MLPSPTCRLSGVARRCCASCCSGSSVRASLPRVRIFRSN